MKSIRCISLVASVAVMLMTPTVSAETQPLDDAQIELIRRNCQVVQATMQRLERTETVTRRNRGVSYEATLKLMVNLNSRVAANKLSAPALLESAAQLEKKITEFDKDYVTYNNSFNITMKLPNCQEQPVTFYDYLNNTRELRAKVAADTDEINVILDEYQTGLDGLKSAVTPAVEPAQ